MPDLPPSRLARVTDAIRAAGCDSLVAVGSGHAVHLCSYVRYHSGPTAVVVDAEGRRTLVVPAYELEAAGEAADAEAVIPYGPRTLGLELDPFPALVAACSEAVAGGVIGTADEIPGVAGAVATAAGATAVDMFGALHDVRLRKDEHELRWMARSYAHTLAAQAAVERDTDVGAREIDLFTSAHAEGQRLAGRPVEFVSDMLGGPRSAMVGCPIGVASERALESGDVLVSDVAIGDGYWGDTARTHIVGENPEAIEVRSFLEGLRANLADMLRPGTVCEDVFSEAKSAIARAFPKGDFPHHAGHGVGLEVFEDPHLIPGDHTVLDTGMLLALEPGVYFPGRFGVRVENLYLVTPQGGVVVTDAAPS